MSTARNEQLFLDGENFRPRIFPNKQFHSERKHTVRKQALGEIKNVIHNHASVTPFKAAGPSKSLFPELLKKQTDDLKSHINRKHNQKVHHLATTSHEALPKKDVPAPKTCNQNCHKGLEEIWSEMNVLEPEILERLINGEGELETDFDIPNGNISPIDFDDGIDLAFDMQDPYELEDEKLLRKILAQDRECSELPLALDWMDDL